MTGQRIIIYGDVNLNITDGSSVWLQSLVEVCVRTFSSVHVVLKYALQPTREISAFAQDGVVVHAPVGLPTSNSVARGEACAVIGELARELAPDVVICRGLDACAELSRDPAVARVLWSYVTDLPPIGLAPAARRDRARLSGISARSRRMLAQTESARSYLEAISPEASGKTLLMPPMIPDDFFLPERDAMQRNDGPVQLVYAGKFARNWRIDNLLDLPAALAGLGVQAHLAIIGDKFQRDEADPTWHERLERKLRWASADPSQPINWLGGLPRKAVLEHYANADVGFGWRDQVLDGSMELSTKLLEYAAARVMPLVNRTPDHEELLGAEYPLFVRAEDTVEQVAQVIASARSNIRSLQNWIPEIAREYSFESASERISNEIGRWELIGPRDENDQRLRVVVASHDFKFMGEIMEGLGSSRGVEVRVDAWETLRDHDPEESARLAHWADVVFCEWAGPVAVWYSRHVPVKCRLLVRLHGFELRAPWLREINSEAVDAFIFVSEEYRIAAIQALRLDPEKTAVIPNVVNVHDLARPKLAGSQFHVGMLGFVGFNKRPDRALDLIERLVASDERYMLHIRGRHPWDYGHEWRKSSQRQNYLEFYSRIARDARLRQHVVFDEFGPDVASWFRRIGWVVSPSHHESFHLAVAEGMASGAVPVIWDRVGAREIFGDQWVLGDTWGAVNQILDAGEERWRILSRAASDQARNWDIARVAPSLAELLLGSQ